MSIACDEKYKRQVSDLRVRAAIARGWQGRVDRLAKQLDDAADSIETLMSRKVVQCSDCGRTRLCHLQPSVGFQDGKIVPAEPAMVCIDLEDCIKDCEA